MRTLRTGFLCLLAMLAAVAGFAADGPRVVTLDSPAPLVEIRVLVRAGAGSDPAGMEGLAKLTAHMLLEGGFGDPKKPVTKEQLAEITRPWGERAYPSVNVSREITVFSMTVPRDALAAYTKQVLQPMFGQPLFDSKELDRLRNEALQTLRSNLRFEQIELLGLVALDNVIFEGTGYAHPDGGTENGLAAVTPDAVRGFYTRFYRPANIVLGVNTTDASITGALQSALAKINEGTMITMEVPTILPPAAVKGRSVLIVAQPNAIATGIHAGFPLPLTRKDADYWPLYVANIWFGTHRDDFSHLYDVIRSERGYNYGDYSYIEHFENRPYALFPPPNVPRRYQYFSIWIRPVQHEYAYHLMKALTWEIENFVRTGLTEVQCALAKNKARVLYLNLAETGSRLLADRLDSAFYGMAPGYLESYLQRIDGVTCAQVNAALRKYLQAENLKYVVVTSKDAAPKLAEQIASNAPAWGKAPADYQIDSKEENGQKTYTVPEGKLELLRRDAAWAHYWLDIPRDRVRIVPADKMFETSALPQ